MRACLGLAVAVAFGVAGVARAEPLDLKQVAADAAWVVHVDVDAAHASTVLHHAMEAMLQKHPAAKEHLAKLDEIWKFNPRENLHGITLYGQRIKRGEGVAIVHAKVDEQLLLEKAKKAPEYQATTYGKHELHTWTHAKGSGRQRSLTGTFYKPGVLVFGPSADDVKAALDVLDGAKPNMADQGSSPMGEIPQGAILVAGARGIAAAELPHASPVAKQTDSFQLALGEYQGESFVVGKLTTKQADVAERVKLVVEGARAMASLHHSDDPEALKIVNALKVTVSDKVVGVQARVSSESLWNCVKKQAEKMPRHSRGPFGGRCPMEKQQ